MSIRGFCVFLLTIALVSGCGGGIGSDSQSDDPVVVDYPIAYVKRPLPGEDDPAADLRQPLAFTAGGDLYVRDRAAPSAPERNVTFAMTQGLGDVKDVESSYDGSTLLFAMRLPDDDPNDNDVPTWNIWEYTLAAGTLRRVIASDLKAEEGDDVAPHYLPDGRIVFSSTRQSQSQAILIDEGKPQFAALTEDRNRPSLNLHVMNADGNDLRQITFNQSHDLDPSVRRDGRILFTRWDHMGGRNDFNLYTVRPDGTDLQLLYGAHSHATGTDNTAVQFVQPREMPDGRVLARLLPFTGALGSGDVVLVDIERYSDNAQPVAAHAGLGGPAQISINPGNIRTDAAPSPGGRFNAAFPLDDGTRRLLVSWTPCRLMDGDAIVPCTTARLAAPQVQEAPPFYGIWIYDLADRRQLPVVAAEEGRLITEVVVAQERSLPTILFDRAQTGELDEDSIDQGVGILHIRSVYDRDGEFYEFGMSNAARTKLEALVESDPLAYTSAGFSADNRRVAYLADPKEFAAADRPARFLRLVKAVSIPPRTVRPFAGSAIGVSATNGMREILGYAPIEPDGSVQVKVPANVAFTIEVLDADGRRIGGRHRNWLQLRPGETLACNGCHTHTVAQGEHERPHSRSDAAAASINRGALTTSLPFAHTEPALVDAGQTMAQTRFQLPGERQLPDVNLSYTDPWTDPDPAQANRPKDTPFNWSYRDVYDYTDAGQAKPVTESCLDDWNSLCRVVIHYESHLHPLWSKPRQDSAANDIACTSCHTTDAGGTVQVPAGQLDLTDGISDINTAHFKAYRELLSNDLRQQLTVDGQNLQNVQRQATDPVSGQLLFQTNPDGSLVLDGSGNPIPIMEDDPTAIVSPSMSTAGAANSRFFTLFAVGGTHYDTAAGQSWLTATELKLLSEWLDLGAQYFNNPFDAPLN